MPEEKEMVFPDNAAEALHEQGHQARLEQISQFQPPSQDGGTTNDPTSANGSIGQRGGESAEDAATDRTAQPGTDLQSVLAAIETNIDSSQAEAVRKVFAENTRLRQAEKTSEQSVEESVRAAVEQALREQLAADAGLDPEDPMSQVSAEQKGLFKRILEEQAAELGFVKADDLTQREASDYLARANADGVKLFGDKFGLEDDQGVVLTDEARGLMTPVYERLQDAARGWTYSDLYKIANFDNLISEAEARGRNGQQTNTQQRVERIQRGRTEQPGAAGVHTSVNIRGERGTPGDKGENVMARAMALAKQQLSR